MTFRFDKLFPRTVWPLACLLVAGPGVALLWAYTPQYEALNSIAGRLAAAVAAQFTTAPSALSAGTDRRELTILLLQCLRTGCALGFAALAWLRAGAVARAGSISGSQFGSHPASLATQLILAVVGDLGLIYVFAAQLGTLPTRRALLRWLAATVVLATAASLLTMFPLHVADGRIAIATMLASAEALIMAIVTALVHVALRERRARLALASAHAELQATQALLGEAVRASERLRLSRDLHDTAGHHLTALKLHLDLARRQAGPSAPAALATASELAATLLADVRLLVSAERSGSTIELRLALETLCAGIPTPRIALVLGERLDINSAALAHTVFCAVQEAISNAIRHAGASTMTISLQRDQQGDLLLDMVDDGCGKGSQPEGNGLRGMRERAAAVGGTLSMAKASGRGFALSMRMPSTAVAA